MTTVELALALCVAVAAFGALSKWVPLPLPIILVAGGGALSYVPGLERVQLDPRVFFLLFVPPLLFSDGWLFPKREFVAFLRPILLLALGLVAATVVAVGYLMHWLVPSLPLAAAFALGAIVSPTDAVATASVTQRLPLPPRVTHIVNGESLINDASGLVAFKFAVAAVATGMFSWFQAMAQFAWLAGGGALIGFAVAAVIGQVRVRLVRLCVDDPKIQTIISLLTPYAAYLAAESLQLSGVLAVVASGLYAGIHDSRRLSLPTRRHAWEVWAMILYVFNGLAFPLLGLQLRSVMLGMPDVSWHTLLGYAAALFVVITLVRLLWVYPGTYVPQLVSQRIQTREGTRDPRAVFLVGWAGIRGSVTLAAALSIPLFLPDGAPFPARDLILFLAGATIILTLLINGLTLPIIIRALNLPHDGGALREERDTGVINDETLRAIEAEIDHAESLVVGDTRAT